MYLEKNSLYVGPTSEHHRLPHNLWGQAIIKTKEIRLSSKKNGIFDR